MKLFNLLFLSAMFIFLFCTESTVNNLDLDIKDNDTIFEGSNDTSHWSNSYNMQITVHDSTVGLIWQCVDEDIYDYEVITSKDSMNWDTTTFYFSTTYNSEHCVDFEVNSYGTYYIKLIGLDSILTARRVLDEGKCEVIKDGLQIVALRYGREVELDYESHPSSAAGYSYTSFKSKDRTNWDTLAYQTYLGGFDFLLDNDTAFYKVVRKNNSTNVEISSNIVSAQFHNEEFDFLVQVHASNNFVRASSSTGIISKYTEVDTVLHYFSNDGENWFAPDSLYNKSAYFYISGQNPLVYHYQIIKTVDGKSYISNTCTPKYGPVFIKLYSEPEAVLIDSSYVYNLEIRYEQTHDSINNQHYELLRSVNGGEFIVINEGFSDSNFTSKGFKDYIPAVGYADYKVKAYFNNEHILTSKTIHVELPLPLTFVTPSTFSLLDMAFLKDIVDDSLVGIADVVIHRSINRNIWKRIDTVSLVNDTFNYVDTLDYAGGYYYATSILFPDTGIESIKCIPQYTYVSRLAPATFQFPMIKRISSTVYDIMLPDIYEISEGVDSIQLLKFNETDIDQSIANSLIWKVIGTRISSPVVIRDTVTTPASYAIRYFYGKYGSHISEPINSNYHERLYTVDSTLAEGELTTPPFGAEIEATGNLQIEWDPQFLPNDTDVRILLYDEGVSSIELTSSTNNDGSYYYDGYKNIGEGLYQIVLTGTTTNPYSNLTDERFVSAPFTVYVKN